MAFLAATALLTVGLVLMNTAIACPASGSVALESGATASTVEVPSTLLASAADLPGVVDAVALTAAAVLVQIAGDTGPQVMWRERAGGEWSST